MLTSAWDYAVAVYRDDRTPLGQASIDPDWEPAHEWLRLSALNEGLPYAACSDTEVLPLWARNGGPAVAGFRMTAANGGGRPAPSCDFPMRYFRGPAQAVATQLVEAGRLADADRYLYVVLATARNGAARAAAAPSFTVRDVTPPPALGSGSMQPLFDRSLAIGQPAPQEAPAFVPQHVLDEIAALTRHATPCETGGALVGHLYRDASARQVFTRVTAQLPASHTEASTSSLRFTPDTWVSLRDEIDARAHGELMVGWWHSHPVREWCRLDECPGRDHDACALARDVFSASDRAVHRTVFSGAHNVALVASDAPTAVRFSVHGWSVGMLQARSLFVLPPGA